MNHAVLMSVSMAFAWLRSGRLYCCSSFFSLRVGKGGVRGAQQLLTSCPHPLQLPPVCRPGRFRVRWPRTPSWFCPRRTAWRCCCATRMRASTSTPMDASPKTWCCSGARCPPPSVRQPISSLLLDPWPLTSISDLSRSSFTLTIYHTPPPFKAALLPFPAFCF